MVYTPFLLLLDLVLATIVETSSWQALTELTQLQLDSNFHQAPWCVSHLLPHGFFSDAEV